MDIKKEIIEEYKQEDFVKDFDKTRAESVALREKHRFETNIVQNALQKKEVNVEEQVLDVACGTGRLLVEIIDNPKVIYTGIDTSPAMINELKKKKKDDRINLLIADATKLPFPDEKFDVVFTYHLLWHIPIEEQKKVIQEMLRVTKKGGKVIIDTINPNFLFAKSNSKVFKISKKDVKEWVGNAEIKTDKFLDPPVKSGFALFNLLNKFNKVLPSDLFHMVYYTITK